MPQQSNMPGDNADSSVENLDTNEIIKELWKKYDELQKERDEIRKESDRIQKENDEIRKDTGEIRKENDEIRKNIDKIQKEKDKIQKENDDLVERIKLRKEISEQFYKKLNHKNEELKKMHEEIILECTKTKEQNARNDQSHDTGTSSSSTSPSTSTSTSSSTSSSASSGTRANKKKRTDSQANNCDIFTSPDSSNPSEYAEASNTLSSSLVDYCTQKCLLGLKNNLPMDTNCPNYDAHRNNTSGQGDLHPIRYDDIPALLYKQIENSKAGCELQSSKTDVFRTIMKITLYPYEYKLVGKGASIDDEMYMKREALIYDVLEEIQGKQIPVFLGYMPLAKTVWIGDGNCMHWIDVMILLSYGGEPLVQGYGQETVRKINKLLLDHGVKNNCIGKRDVLWNEELEHEMVVNFEESYYTGTTKKVLCEKYTEGVKRAEKRYR